MKTVYYIDENCRDKLELMPALRDILLHEGAGDVKVAVTASEFFYRTAFRVKDKDLYFDAKQVSTSNRDRAFLTRHQDMLELLPVYADGYADHYEQAFLRLVKPFLALENAEKMPPDIEAEVRQNAAHIIAKYTPELTTASETREALAKRIDLTIDLDNPERSRHDAAILAACMRSGKLGNILKKRDHENYLAQLPALVKPFLTAEHNESLPAEIIDEIRSNAEYLFSHSSSKQNRPVDNSIEVAIHPDDPQSASLDGAIIEACKQSQLMRKLVKKRHSEPYLDLYLSLIDPYLRADEPKVLPELISDDIKRVAADIIKQTAPELTTPEEKPKELAKRLSLKLHPGDPAYAKLDDVIIMACRQSEPMRRMIKKENKDAFDALFEEMLKKTLLPENARTITPEIQADVQKYATPLVNKITQPNDSLSAEPFMVEGKLDLSLHPEDKTRRQHDEIILKACYESPLLETHLKKRTNNFSTIGDDLADREIFSYAKRKLKPPEGEPEEKVKFVVVTDDEPFTKKLNKFLFKGAHKDSVCIGSDAFMDVCKQKITALRTPPAADAPAETHGSSLELAAALEAAYLKIYRAKPPEKKASPPAVTESEDQEPKARRQSAGWSDKDDAPIIRPKTIKPKKPDEPEPKPKPISHELDPSKLGLLDFIAYQKSLTVEQRKKMGVETPKEFFAKMYQELQKSELCFIKITDSPETLSQISEHPYFTIAKKFPKPENEDASPPKKQQCLISEKVPQAVRKVLQEQLGISEADLDKIKISEHGTSYRVDIPFDFPLPIETTQKAAKLISNKIGNILGTKVSTKTAYKPDIFSQPYLFVPKSFAKNADVAEADAPALLRNVIQSKLGLKECEISKFIISVKNDYYRIKIPDIITEYDAVSDDPEFEAGAAIKTSTQTRDQIVRALHEELGATVKNTEESPIYENKFKFSERKPPEIPAPLPSRTEPKKVSHALDISKMTFFEEIAYRRSLPEGQQLEATKDSNALNTLKAGVIYYSKIDEAPKKRAPSVIELPSVKPELLAAMKEVADFCSKNQSSKPTQKPLVSEDKPRLTYEVLNAMKILSAFHSTVKSNRVQGNGSRMPGQPRLTSKLHSALRYIAEAYSKLESKTQTTDEARKELPKVKPLLLNALEEVAAAHADEVKAIEHAERYKLKLASEAKETPPAAVESKNNPYLFFSLPKFQEALVTFSPENLEKSATEVVRDILAYELALPASQIGAIKVEKAQNGTMLKVQIPSITYTYDAFSGDPEIAEGAAVHTHTLSPAQVAEILSQTESLGVPISNTEATAVPDSSVKLPIKKEPEEPKPKEDPHKADIERLPFAERFEAFSRMSSKQRKSFVENNPELAQMRESNIWFIKNNDGCDPYLFMSPHVRDNLGLKSDAELESTMRGIFRSALGLKYHQLSSIKLEKAEASGRMYKVKIPAITYVNDEDGPSPTIETLSAVEVAKVLEENIGARLVGSPNRPVREGPVFLMRGREAKAVVVKPATQPPDETEEPKSTKLQRFTNFIKRKIDEAAAEPVRPNFFSDRYKPGIEQGSIRFIKENDKTSPYLFLPKPMLAKMEKINLPEQCSHDLCEFLLTLSDDEQKLACGALEKLLGITVTPESIYTADHVIAGGVAARYKDKADPFEAFLDDFKKEDIGTQRPMERYNRPLHELGSTLKDMIQTAMDLSDVEKEAIVFDTRSFTKDPCKVKLSAVMYSIPEISLDEDKHQSIAMKSGSYSPEEVATALHNEFNIAVEPSEGAAGSVGKHSKKTGAKGGR